MVKSNFHILGSQHGHHRESNEKDYQNNSSYKETSLYTPLGAEDRIGLSENTPDPATLDLKQDSHYQSNGHHYLYNI